MPAARRVLLFLLAILALLFFLAVPSVSFAQSDAATASSPTAAGSASFADAAKQLAAKIAAGLPPREAITPELRNLSSLSAAEVAAARRALEAELQARGLLLNGPSQERVSVRVTFSENLQGYIWVADWIRNDSAQIAIVTLARPAGSPQNSLVSSMVLRRQLIWEQEEPILDLLIQALGAGREPTLLVLEPSRLATYKKHDGSWQLDRRYALARSSSSLRDMRGRFKITAKSVEITFAGDSCVLPQEPGTEIECHSVEQPWPPSAGGIVERMGKKTPPAFSETSLRADRRLVIAIAGMDGLARLYEQGADPVAAVPGWGSDLLAVQSPCGSGSQLLVTGTEDFTVSDVIQAYEIHDRQAVAVSPPMEVPGPVTALVPFGSDLEKAIAVVRNLKTGRFEALQLSISCAQ